MRESVSRGRIDTIAITRTLRFFGLSRSIPGPRRRMRLTLAPCRTPEQSN